MWGSRLISVDVNCTLELHLHFFALFSRLAPQLMLFSLSRSALSWVGPQFRVWAGQFCTSIKVYSPVSRLLNTSKENSVNKTRGVTNSITIGSSQSRIFFHDRRWGFCSLWLLQSFTYNIKGGTSLFWHNTRIQSSWAQNRVCPQYSYFSSLWELLGQLRIEVRWTNSYSQAARNYFLKLITWTIKTCCQPFLLN